MTENNSLSTQIFPYFTCSLSLYESTLFPQTRPGGGGGGGGSMGGGGAWAWGIHAGGGAWNACGEGAWGGGGMHGWGSQLAYT